MLKDFVDLKPGDMVIQNGANSAVGRAAIEVETFRNLKDLEDCPRSWSSNGEHRSGSTRSLGIGIGIEEPRSGSRPNGGRARQAKKELQVSDLRDWMFPLKRYQVGVELCRRKVGAASCGNSWQARRHGDVWRDEQAATAGESENRFLTKKEFRFRLDH